MFLHAPKLIPKRCQDHPNGDHTLSHRSKLPFWMCALLKMLLRHLPLFNILVDKIAFRNLMATILSAIQTHNGTSSWLVSNSGVETHNA